MNSRRIHFETPVSVALKNACADACNVARIASDIADNRTRPSRAKIDANDPQVYGNAFDDAFCPIKLSVLAAMMPPPKA